MLFFFCFNDTATTEIYTLSLHDALPIYLVTETLRRQGYRVLAAKDPEDALALARSYGHPIHLLVTDVVMPKMKDRKSTRLNSSHGYISYAVFCLKKKTRKVRLSENQLQH